MYTCRRDAPVGEVLQRGLPEVLRGGHGRDGDVPNHIYIFIYTHVYMYMCVHIYIYI